MKLFFTTLFSIITQLLLSQNDFKPGSIVLNNDDTLVGQINYRKDRLDAENIVFSYNGKENTYNVSEVKAIIINNEFIYTRYQVSYQLGAANLQDAKEAFTSPSETKIVWLRLLYKSTYSLYELYTPKRMYFFIFSEKDGIKELVYRVRVNAEKLEKDEQYKNLLISYAGEAGTEAEIKKRITSIKYDRDDLLRIFSLLNKDKSSFKEKIEFKSLIDVSAGVSYTALKPSGNLFQEGGFFYAFNTADFESKAGFIGGMGVTIVSSKNKGKIQSRVGLNILSLSVDGENNSGTGTFPKEKYKGLFIIAEPSLIVERLLKSTPKNQILAGLFGSINFMIKNDISSTFERAGIVTIINNTPNINTAYLAYGISGTMIAGRGRINMRLFSTSNFYSKSSTKLRGLGVYLTYGYIFKK